MEDRGHGCQKAAAPTSPDPYSSPEDILGSMATALCIHNAGHQFDNVFIALVEGTSSTSVPACKP